MYKRQPKNCGNYITVDVVTALKARVALQMDDYENAAKYAGDLVNSNRYPLSNTATDFESVWKDVYKRQIEVYAKKCEPPWIFS